MENMLTFASRELVTFEEKPFCQIDSLILSWLSYIQFPEVFSEIRTHKGIRIRDLLLAEYFEKMKYGVKSPDDTIRLLVALGVSPRYRDIRLFDYEDELDHELDLQFAAVTCQIGKHEYYIAYRGTDDSFTGWKEDLNLCLPMPVPAQICALNYASRQISAIPGAFRIGGHSKGGNVAVFAAAELQPELQDRVISVDSFDGPGFKEEDRVREGIARLGDRLCKTIPQSSLVGMIFGIEGRCQIVKSTAIGVLQHDPFSWKLSGDSFELRDELTQNAKITYRGLNRWIEGMDIDERRKFIESVFDILEETGEDGFDTLVLNIQKDLPVIVGKIASLDKETRQFLLKVFFSLAAEEVGSVPVVFREGQRIRSSEAGDAAADPQALIADKTAEETSAEGADGEATEDFAQPQITEQTCQAEDESFSAEDSALPAVTEKVTQTAGRVLQTAADGVTQTAGRVLQTAADGVTQTAGRVLQTASDGVTQTAGRALQAASDGVTQTAGRALQTAADGASQMADRALQTVSDTRSDWQDRFLELVNGDNVQEITSFVQDLLFSRSGKERKEIQTEEQTGARSEEQTEERSEEQTKEQIKARSEEQTKEQAGERSEEQA